MAFLKAVEDGPEKIDVYLNSPGGNLLGALKLGSAFRQRGVSVYVGRTVPYEGGFDQTVKGTCASACAFAFLGGGERHAQAGELGVHQFYDPVSLASPTTKSFDAFEMSAQQALSAIVVDYVVQMGVDPRAASIAGATSPNEIHFFTDAELNELRVAWEPGRFEPWKIEPYAGGLVAYSKSQDQLSTLTVFCRGKGGLRVLATGFRISDERVASTLTGLDHISAFGRQIASNHWSIKRVDGRLALEVDLGDFRPDQLSQDATFEVSANEYAGHVDWGVIDLVAPKDMARETIKLASKNCIR